MTASVPAPEPEKGTQTSKARIRVLICDDLARVRRGLRLALETEDDFELVGEARNGQEAVEMASRLSPDVVLLDLQMPGLDGIAAAQEIISRGAARAVV